MEKEKQIIKMYLDGKTGTQISNELGIGRRSVYRILHKNNIELQKDVKKKNPQIKNCAVCERKCSKTLCSTCQTNKRRYETKLKAVEYLGGGCKNCGWKGDPSGFDFHHRDPSEKEFNANAHTIASMSWELAKSELDKCDLLCALCHRLEHSNYKLYKNYINK